MKSPFTNVQACICCKKKELVFKFKILHPYSSVLTKSSHSVKDESASIYLCTHCGHCLMSPRITDSIMSNYYSVLNSEFYANRQLQPSNENIIEYKYYTKIIKQQIGTHARILEIGCGNGFLLKKLEEEGYHCTGVEPSPSASKHALNELGLRVEKAFLEQSSFFQEKFDVVIAIDVVEHISDLSNFIKTIKKVMNPNGLIFIGTGNIDSLNAKIAGKYWGYFLSWEHVSFFTPQSISYVLRENGFDNIKVEKTSLQHKPLQNIFEFSKNIIKFFTNKILTKKYYHGICFDHLIVTAKNNVVQ